MYIFYFKFNYFLPIFEPVCFTGGNTAPPVAFGGGGAGVNLVLAVSATFNALNAWPPFTCATPPVVAVICVVCSWAFDCLDIVFKKSVICCVVFPCCDN